MIICLCKNINTAQVQVAVAQGVTDVDQLRQTLGLGSECGGCVEYAKNILKQSIVMQKSITRSVASVAFFSDALQG